MNKLFTVVVNCIWKVMFQMCMFCFTLYTVMQPWDPPDTESHHSSGMSLNIPCSSGHHVTPSFRDVPGLFWNLPCGILQTPSLWGYAGLHVLGCPLWDPPDTMSPHHLGMSQDCPEMSIVESSRCNVIPIFGDMQNCPGMPLMRSSVHQVTPAQTSRLCWIPLCPAVPETCQTFLGNTGHPSHQ